MKHLAQTTAGTTAMLTGLLDAVAAASLLVGGIGIMNIMLVSVTERMRDMDYAVHWVDRFPYDTPEDEVAAALRNAFRMIGINPPERLPSDMIAKLTPHLVDVVRLNYSVARIRWLLENSGQ